MGDVDWIYLSQDRNQRQAVVNTVMNRRLKKKRRGSPLVAEEL